MAHTVGEGMSGNSGKIDRRTAALFALAVTMMVALVVAWRIDAEASTAPPGQSSVLRVVDERDAPVVGATVEYNDTVATTDETGSVTVNLHAPELAVVQATGMLPDAVVVGDREETTLQLLATVGPGGDRTVLNFAGDFMMGRRFVSPEAGDPLVTDDATARAVVSDIAPLFELADLSTVNLETIIGTLSVDDAAAGKRYLLESSPCHHRCPR